MNERNLSRRLSTQVVDALKAHGHILVVKGGATALARELDELMTPEIVTIEPRLQPLSVLVGEPTSTFGDEAVDQAVEDMVLKLTRALMSSDHVEDVFAEDAVIRRDIFRVVRDGLHARPHEGGDDTEHTAVTVKLDMLGYVAATASRLADPSILRQALDRAASFSSAQFSGFSPELREATFRLEDGGDDERLELEEAVADELTDLVEHGIVELPTIERRIDLGRALAVAEHRALRARIAAAADTTLEGSGCAATWDVPDARTVRVLFTPLSESDSRAVDAPTAAFAREIAAILASAAPPAPAAVPSPASSRSPASSKSPPSSKAAPSSKSPSSKASASTAPASTKATKAAKAKTLVVAEPAPSAPAAAKRRPTAATAKPSAKKASAPAKTPAKTAKKSATKKAAKPATKKAKPSAKR